MRDIFPFAEKPCNLKSNSARKRRCSCFIYLTTEIISGNISKNRGIDIAGIVRKKLHFAQQINVILGFVKYSLAMQVSFKSSNTVSNFVIL